MHWCDYHYAMVVHALGYANSELRILPRRLSQGVLKCAASHEHTLTACVHARKSSQWARARPRPAETTASACARMLPIDLPPLLAKTACSRPPVRVRVSSEPHALRCSRRVGKCDAVYQGRVLRISEHARARHEGWNDCSELTCLARSHLGDHAWARAAPARPEPNLPC